MILHTLSFNILVGGSDCAGVGFPGQRHAALAEVIHQTGAELVGIQEDPPGEQLLTALGEGWNRAGSIYARFPLTTLSSGPNVAVCRVSLPGGQSIVAINCHWRAYPYGPYDLQELVRQGKAPELEIFLDSVDKTSGPRGYDETSAALLPYLQAGERVVLTGDFNEPSHLDWTERASRFGLTLPWRGSQRLTALGLHDAYRSVFPDEIAKPGITWTPPYPDGLPDRRPYCDEVLDRIDLIYIGGPGIRVRDAAVVTGREGQGERRLDLDWPSDHWAVLAMLDLS